MSSKRLIEQKRNVLLEMKTITRLMDEALKTGDTDKFVKLIDDRQILMEQIDNFYKDDALIENNPTASRDNDYDNALKEEIAMLVKDIQLANNKLQNRAEEYLGEIKKKLINLRNSKKAAQSYSSRNSQVFGRFIEKKK
jgi:hypothetical protein